MKLFEVKLEVLSANYFSIDDIRSNIKDSLDDNPNIDLTHIRVKISEKKCKNWIIDKDRKINYNHVLKLIAKEKTMNKL